MKKINFEEFVEKANKIHDNKFTYHKETYTTYSEKTKITCPIHGDFWQKPNIHVLGHGCLKCKSEKIKKSKTTSFEEFVEKANKIHDNKFTYHKETYTKIANKTKITCPIHGDFWQEARSHINGFGCKKCTHLYMDKELFITKSNIIHNNKYDYSKVEYINAKTKVCIICPEHGEFWQTPDKHLNRKQGCPKCSQRHLEKETENILFENKIKFEYQKGFSWLGKQSLDFYLPDYNIAIECQGIQHFQPVDFANNGEKWAKELFKINKNRDKKKKILCENNNLKLEYIKYNENVKNKIKKILKKNEQQY